MQIFQELNEEGSTIVMVTHEPDIGQHCKRIVSIRDGRITEDEPVSNRIIAADELKVMYKEQDEHEAQRKAKVAG
jgi:putative ABC transport system ATP-binding protein